MIIDLRSEGPEVLEADVAIAGAGAAGITMASALVKRGFRVLLLESGGLDYEPETADLNRGENIGQDYYELENSRLRFFGGTTAIWGGRCAELDAIDFERREWVPHSGWPFAKDELQPWYAAARKLFDIPGGTQEPGSYGLLDRLGTGDVKVRHWWFDNAFDRFGLAKNKHLVEHPSPVVALHATVREIVPSPDGNSVVHFLVRAGSGKLHRARARTYILAAGGLENARILLASNSVVQTGVGNGHDLVGRFFMEHPHARGGRLVGASVPRVLNAFRRRSLASATTAPLITLADEAQKREESLNSALTVAARPPAGGRQALSKKAYEIIKHKTAPTDQGRALWRAYRRLGRAVKGLGPLVAAGRCKLGQHELALIIRAEQAPNPDSRVQLIGEADSTGMPRISLDWRMNSQDVESVSALVGAFGRECERTGIGRVEAADWLQNGGSTWVTDPLISAHPLGGYHHMGTTRMADDPKQGVTDRWGQVHGVGNLYVAGSSLFPTGGWANPTLTIVALALRTADRLSSTQN